MALVFWIAAALLVQTYVGYLLSLVAWDAWWQLRGALWFVSQERDRRGRRVGEGFEPNVTLVVPAYDEEGCIGAKLDNSLSLDYPAPRFEVLIGSDGSTDRTDGLVQACPDPRVRLSAAARGGKVAVLNRCIPAAQGEIVVLTDANTMIDKRAVRRLVRHFADPSVGAVCGRLKLYNRLRKEYEESTYWTYETLLKLYEGKHGAVLGANGGLYAIRRALFAPLPPDTIVDDFVIPLRILEAGYQVRFDPEAAAYEETTEDYACEFARRARIGAGNFQSLSRLPGLLNPSRGFAAYAFWSHKVLRWCAPLLLALALMANAALAFRSGVYLAIFVGQLGFYALAALGASPLPSGGLRRVASPARYFVAMNLALLVGFFRFLRGSQRAAWDRTARTNPN
jgi:cellulose synthase/poly-beta-1,6-N-acetylglucosamine synthase-like glycosyltransferase